MSPVRIAKVARSSTKHVPYVADILSTLYKKTSTGAIQYWTISVYEDSDHSTAYIIQTEYGQVGTESPQVTFDTIWEGKNLGKKNETSAHAQALAEATAKWEKQQKKGYVNSIDMAEAGGLSSLIEGGIVPMLAHKFTDHAHKIKYPAYVQPKLDGIRCIAILDDGKCTLWSRTRKPITGVPHIQRELEKAFPRVTTILDGELYNHTLKSNFEKIVSMVRQEEPAEGHEIVEYHVYDLPNVGGGFFKRAATLGVMPTLLPFEKVKFVQTDLVQNEDEVMAKFEEFRAQGYEGAMLRNSSGDYANKRSYDLQKVKEFDDAEFEIVGIEEGRGKLQGHAGAFQCRTSDGKAFLAKMSGELENLKRYFDDHSLWQGKKLTVKYQGLTGANGVPRFPIGVTIRDYE